MHNLLTFFLKYSYWLVFAICELTSIVLLVRFNNYQRSVWFTSANTFVAQVHEWQSELTSFFNMSAENRLLTNQNVVLQQRITDLNHRLQLALHQPNPEEVRLDSMIGGFTRIDAQVIANTVTRRDNYLTINKGILDGIKPDMGVVSGTGVIGTVYMTAPHYSIVLPILNSKSRISCRIRGTHYFGNLSWNGDNPFYATIDMPRHVKVEVGQAIESSAHSSLLPEGMFIGKISQIDDSDDGLFYRLGVHLGVDFATLREVCVVYHEHLDEIQAIEAEVGLDPKGRR